MKKSIYKFESTMWLMIKFLLYVALLMIFIFVLGKENIGLNRLSRTLGITVSTFCIVGLLFVSVYGKFDVGRRKSKPIIASYTMTLFCTDIITYLQLMIMRTNKPNVSSFALYNVGLLVATYVLQLVVVIIFTYAGNWLFFKIHEPESCCLITSSQKRVDEMVFSLQQFQKQYEIVSVLDYRSKNIEKQIQQVNTVFVYDIPVEKRAQIMRICYRYSVNVYFNPEIEDIMELNAENYILNDLFLLNKNVKMLSMEQRIAKRLLDITLSLVLGVLSAPLWIAAIIAIKLEDGGSAIFKQKRATIHGREFEVYKLRTMIENSKNYSAKENDDRITKIGKFLRRTRIDELPQLLNVLKGDMSFVGPRPEMLENVDAYEKKLPEFRYRLRMKAGLTGYAQIQGKYNTSPKDKLLMDMMYIEHYSIWRDIQLILQTAIVLLKSDSTEAFGKQKKQGKYIFVSCEEEK